jgi:ParB family transcriptional regulator, chromosome partitioning protein
MTITTRDTADAAPDAQTVQPGQANSPFGTPGQAASRPVIAVELLTAHPGNVRRDISLDQEYLDSVAELGITEVPCDLAADRETDEAGQFLDMYVTNHHRKGHTRLEEADALFAASANGATRTRIRKATGLSRDEVAAALKAGGMTGFAREVAGGFGHGITVDQLALLAEFDGDTEAVTRLMNAFCDGRNGQHTAEQIRQERTELADHQDLVTRLTASGYTVTTELPPGAVMLHALLHDGQDLTEEADAACPGRGTYFTSYQPLAPRHFCSDPEANGHLSRYQPAALPDLRQGAGDSTPGKTGPHPGEQPAPDPARKLVIEGNRAWVTARAVRRRWLASTLLARRTAPREALPFITTQLLTMPQALRDAITRAPCSQLFDELTGGTIRPDAAGAWPHGRLPLALLAVIATAYEDRMDGDAGRATWRTDQRYTQCNREEAGTYLRFLASAGYELSPVEQAVAGGQPYTGDQPGDALDAASQPEASIEPASTGADPAEVTAQGRPGETATA